MAKARNNEAYVKQLVDELPADAEGIIRMDSEIRAKVFPKVAYVDFSKYP